MTTAAPLTGQLHMIRADLDVKAFHRWASERDLIARNTFDEGYALHHLLVQSFGCDRAPRPFRVIIPRPERGRQRRGTLYGYTSADAAALRDAAMTYACPLQSKVLPAARLCSKQMPTTWSTGQRLGFEVLVRPVVRPKNRRLNTRGGGTRRPGAETDVWQWEAEKHPRGEMKRSREQVYTAWLAARLAGHGAALEPGTRLASFQRVRTVRPYHDRATKQPRTVRKRRAHATEGPHAVLQGTLTITDPDAFAGLVAHGIGRHRAYGYGMVLLRPPRPPAGP